MINYLLTSTFIHAGILLSLCYTPVSVNTLGAIEVNIVEKQKMHDRAPILHTSHKPLIPGPGPGKVENVKPIDIKDYADQLKAKVDPVYYSKVHGLEDTLPRKYTTIVLLFPDKHGKIVSMKVIKSSGIKDLDNLAIQTLREVNTIPIPPESLVKDGIEWDFSVGGGK